MLFLKVITTVGIVAFGAILAWFIHEAEDRASVLGFMAMEVVYVLSLTCMWWK